jgi:hypothetical protein
MKRPTKIAKGIYFIIRPVHAISDHLHRRTNAPHPRRITRLFIGVVTTFSGVAIMEASEHFVLKVLFESVGLYVHASGVATIARNIRKNGKNNHNQKGPMNHV